MNIDATVLVPRRERGWRAGLGAMLSKENAAWWRTRKWWVMCLLWLLALNVTLALNTRGSNPAMAFAGYLVSAAIFVPIAAISLAQDSIFRERHAGTAAWVLTKPLARPAFVIAKAAAIAFGLLVTAIVLPGVVAWVQLAVLGGVQFPLLGFAGIMGLELLTVLFYLSLTLMLATLFAGRGPVLAVALALLIGWMFASGTIVKHAGWLADIVPWILMQSVGPRPALAALLAMGKPLPTVLPIVATAVWSALFLLIAVLRFRREEV
jgi:ABC-type transport system involved in multi-copper enzyme maturation permease subunit